TGFWTCWQRLSASETPFPRGMPLRLPPLHVPPHPLSEGSIRWRIHEVVEGGATAVGDVVPQVPEAVPVEAVVARVQVDLLSAGHAADVLQGGALPLLGRAAAKVRV